jgi:hypothetical protein
VPELRPWPLKCSFLDQSVVLHAARPYSWTGDQHPVGALSPDGPYPALGISVRPRLRAGIVTTSIPVPDSTASNASVNCPARPDRGSGTCRLQEACSRALRPLSAPMRHESAAGALKTVGFPGDLFHAAGLTATIRDKLLAATRVKVAFLMRSA